MEQKKKPSADVYRKTWTFFFTGLVLSLALVITAFEWKFYDDLEVVSLGTLEQEETEILDIPITEMPPPPPPVLQQPEIIEVPDEEEIEQEVEMDLDVEIKEEKAVVKPIKIDAPPPPPQVEEEKDEIFLVVEESAQPKGGFPEFYKYVGKNINYPKQARRMGVEGKVIIQVVIDKDGSLTDIIILKGIGSGCDEEAIRVLKESPKWTPGKQRGRPVKQKMTVPIQFKLS
jgi:protein TonB